MLDTSRMPLLGSGLLVSSQRHRPCSLSALPTALSADRAPIVTAEVKTATEVPCRGTFWQSPERGALARRKGGRCKRVVSGELHQGGLSISCWTQGGGHARKTSLAKVWLPPGPENAFVPGFLTGRTACIFLLQFEVSEVKNYILHIKITETIGLHKEPYKCT